MANKINQSLYGGSLAIEFYPESHRYKLAGERTYLVSVTAVTSIIDKSRVLIPWAVGLAGAHLRQFCESVAGRTITIEELLPVIEEALIQHIIKKETATDIGRKVHDFAEEFAKFKAGQILACPEITDDIEDGVKNGINAFLDWFNANNVKFIDAERLIYSKKHVYAGLADAVAEVNGKKLLIDYKTGKGVYNEAYYQVAGYVLAYEEEMGEKLDGALILNFNKETGEMNAEIEIDRGEIEKNKETFLHCLGVKKREKELQSAYYQQTKVEA